MDDKMVQFRNLLKQELKEALESAEWDDDKMYDLALCLLGRDHLMTQRLKELMTELYGPIMD